MIDLLQGYPLAVDVVTGPEHFDEQGHLNNGAAVLLFGGLRRAYVLGLLREHGGRGLVVEGGVVAVRELVCCYDSEARPSDRLRGGCRVLGRSRRSWLYDELLVTGDRVVARCRVVECAVRDGVAVEVPTDFWSVVEQVEGRSMPVGPVAGPRTDWDAGPTGRT